MKLYYQGSLGPDRLPVSVLGALALLPGQFVLDFVGYESPGCPGYIVQLLATALERGLAERVRYLGVLSHQAARSACAASDIGLALLVPADSDMNTLTLAGASNKVYEYLAGGLPIVVNRDSPVAVEVVESGVGLACDAGDPQSIAEAVTILAGADTRKVMGQRGLDLVQKSWNYDEQFRPVREVILQARRHV